MAKVFRDFLGNEVRVGDLIFYSTTGRYAESRVVRISRFTEKSVFGVIQNTNRPHEDYKIGEEVRVGNSFVLTRIRETPDEQETESQFEGADQGNPDRESQAESKG